MNFFFAILNDRVLMWNRIKYLNDGVLHSIKAPAFNQANFMYLHSIAETEELKQKRINGIHQDLFKLTAEMEFRGNGNRINGGESVFS